MAMADTNQNPITSANTSQEAQNTEAKKSFFWGNEAVFENLEKFEQISNPTDGGQDFDFSFTDEELKPEAISSQNPASDEQISSENWELKTDLPSQQIEEKADPMDMLYGSESANIEEEPSEVKDQNLDIEMLPSKEDPIVQEESKPEETPLQSFESEIWASSNMNQNSEFEEVQASESLGEDELEESEENEVIEDQTAVEEGEEPNSIKTEQELIDEQKMPESSDPTELTQSLDDEKPEEEATLSVEAQAVHEMESEPQSDFSELMQKYQELFSTAKHILKLENKINKEQASTFEILGNNTEKNMITYEISPLKDENQLTRLILFKKEKDFARDEETTHELIFEPQEKMGNLTIIVDSTLLYEEEKDLQDPVRAMQVMDKINKFAFLFEQRTTELEEKREEIKAEKERIRPFRDIFRNF